ncbi:hypothetical protein [Maribacter sp.]|uniref:hypothetical protein n=1 Tax=Maribacter sp. TaxID=1897614 RepID=UPI0025BF4106|nr:hypothetical protein [Maribacter sp.]
MSIFPKKTVVEKRITIHTSFFFKNSSKSILANFKITNPLGKVISMPNQEFFYFPKKTSNYINNKNDYCEGQSGIIYAKFLEQNLLASNNLTTLFDKFTLATHSYFSFKIDSDFPPGKYMVNSSFIIDGIQTKSNSSDVDFFLVEKLKITRNSNQIIIENLSPETTTFRIIYRSSNLEHEFVESVAGNSSYAIPSHIETDDAFLVYAEDQEIRPFFTGRISYRNPKVQYLSKRNSSFVKIDEENCFNLEGKLHEFWLSLNGFRSKESLINEFDSLVYNKLLSKKLIVERDNLT